VQSAVRLDRRRHKVLHFLSFTHIGLHKDSFVSLAFDQGRGLDGRWIDITDYDLRAVVRKELRSCATNPSTPSRDERDLP
jgi:hypothetical protein